MLKRDRAVKRRRDSAAIGLCVADFDHDGFLGVAVGNSPSGTFGLFRGNGTVSLTSAPLSVGNATYALVAADFNGDGRRYVATPLDIFINNSP